MAAPFVTAGSVVVDVGANCGRFSEWALRHIGVEGRVLAIEPDPRCRPDLERYPTVQKYYGAVGAWTRPGEGRLFQMPRETTTSALLWNALPDTKERPQATSVIVDVTRLDALIERATLVKIDAQGLDHQVLQGAPKLLQACDAWIVECWPRGLIVAQSSPHALWQELVNAGLTVCFADGVVVTEDNLAEWERSGQTFVNWLATR